MASLVIPLGGLGLVLLTGVLLFYGAPPWVPSHQTSSSLTWEDFMDSTYPKVISKTSGKSRPLRPDCDFFNCLDVHSCSPHHRNIKVYIYPPTRFLDEQGEELTPPLSSEFHAMLQTVFHSKFYTPDPSSACLFLPFVDTLDLSQKSSLLNLSKILGSLEHWKNGKNHILFNIIPPGEHWPTLPTDEAIMATSSLLKRQGFDLTLPIVKNVSFDKFIESRRDKLLLILTSSVDDLHLLKNLEKADKEQTLTLVEGGEDLSALRRADFCLLNVSSPPWLLSSCLSAGCLPVLPPSFLSSPWLPSLIPWRSVSVVWRGQGGLSGELIHHLRSISRDEIEKKRKVVQEVYELYLSSPGAVMLALMAELEQRLYPSSAESLSAITVPPLHSNPLSLALQPPREEGFTAVVLSYNRVQPLFQVVTKISQAPSLVRVVVVWNHQSQAPPPVEDWPRISVPLKVIQTSANHLSNRFYPYQEIETDCVLSLDDDIHMLTSDELEFGYQVWRESQDRIVGFPARTHSYLPESDEFRYESEWTNHLSIVLTGVAFYHSYWHYLYTAAPSPGAHSVKQWVDTHINCEDIAFNLMVANATGKAPIKVGPRKKFKCSTPSCENASMISGNAGHLEERSGCLDRFLKIYRDSGFNPASLQKVEFRADPVLFKENFPDSMKDFRDIGSL